MNKKEKHEIEMKLKQEAQERREKQLSKPKPNKYVTTPFLTGKQASFIKYMALVAFILGLTIGISRWFDSNRLVWQSPIILRTPVYIEKRAGVGENNANAGWIQQTTTPTSTPSATPTTTPTPTPRPKKARVSAYSCGGLTTYEEIKMNCPSLINGKPETATGTTPIANRTVACDRANLGKQFELDGIGIVTCEDVGGAIKGAGRFDLYLETVQEARQFGVQELAYKPVEITQ